MATIDCMRRFPCLSRSSDIRRLSSTLAAVLVLACALAGCVSSGESAERDALTAQVGMYPSPPPGLQKARIGVPAFTITGAAQNLDQFAADQLTTLAFQTGRFDVIERAQLEKLLAEQDLEGVVEGDEAAAAGHVRGVDYLVLGKISNLRVKREKAKRGFSLGGVPVPGAEAFRGAGFEKGDMTITAECGVDLRLVDPSSGQVAVSNFSEFKRTDSASALAISVLGSTSEADADIALDDDNKGKILRLALDDAVRKMLPDIDQTLLARTRSAVAAEASATASGTTGEEPAAGGAESAPSFCSSCGAKLTSGANFCGSCGAKVGS